MWRILLFASVVFAPAAAYSQQKASADGPDRFLMDFAETLLNDHRSIEQIKQDNATILAAAKGDTEAVRKALKNGSRINARLVDNGELGGPGDTGYTALMFAVLKERTDVIKLLIDNNADLEVKHLEGWTALYLAVERDRKEAVDLLVKAGAKQDPAKIRLSLELLDAACKGFDPRSYGRHPPYPGGPDGDTSKFPDVVAVLNKGANVNMPNPKGYTPLMFAANLGLVENVSTLLAHGADAALKSTDGETALSLADRDIQGFAVEERRQVVKILKDHPANRR